MNKLALLHRIDSEYAYPLDEKKYFYFYKTFLKILKQTPLY